MLLRIIPSSDIFERPDKFLSNISEQCIVCTYEGFEELYVLHTFGKCFVHVRNILLPMGQEYKNIRISW